MADSESEEDYMNMIIEEKPKQETSIQRAARLRKEREERGRPKPKAELQAEQEAATRERLETALPSTNKGFKMMEKMGFKQGSTLGKSKDARKEPIGIQTKDDRSGIGLESEKKRKFREQAEEVLSRAKRSKEDEGDWREMQRQKQKEGRRMKDLANAQRTAERLEDVDFESKDPTKVPLKSINVLWRGLNRQRLEKLREKREKIQLTNSLTSRLPTLAAENDDEDNDYKIAFGSAAESSFVDDDLDDGDEEFEEFEALPVEDRLQKVADFLREKHRYCVWCGDQYPDVAMEGCPGSTESAHDD
ncbi:G-patch-domain-containing protein [Aaosphaeria arxii CBS 175.79]|uniref:G-patch-domain-containing protein n=1 Tax=Aaosphaeria arxii CBS 175.79 TaxID=1450172 RepID=A0A6A5XJ39_9PLEO|nr:G-patch-domain-containing protein [Aaosphaeria arxii CBS 175.79]KAF2013288.1 G-patch-domain-containing protein [Aaosphaeria arxii CBS 175.79]